MILAFAVFTYFPHGGLQRDFLRIAQRCQTRGYTIRVYTSQWQGPCPVGFVVHRLPAKGYSNHNQMAQFHQQLSQAIAHDPPTLLIGFNKMPGLDIYFAADVCYRAKALQEHTIGYRLMPRFRTYQRLERAVFAHTSNTRILALTEQQIADFQQQYHTPTDRFHLLPPSIPANPYGAHRVQIRLTYRQQWDIPENDIVMLLVASRFRTKGLDRAITALAALPQSQQPTTHLVVVGGDRAKPYIAQAARHHLHNRVHFLGARDDIQQLMVFADLLIHPAYTESAGMVLLEAIAAGLPVLTTDVCGYAHHIQAANAGVVLPSPFQQAALNQAMYHMITAGHLHRWQQNACQYAAKQPIDSLHEQAAQLIDQHAQQKNTVA